MSTNQEELRTKKSSRKTIRNVWLECYVVKMSTNQEELRTKESSRKQLEDKNLLT